MSYRVVKAAGATASEISNFRVTTFGHVEPWQLRYSSGYGKNNEAMRS